jgi:hypothetical protein
MRLLLAAPSLLGLLALATAAPLPDVALRTNRYAIRSCIPLPLVRPRAATVEAGDPDSLAAGAECGGKALHDCHVARR